jgi:hypothetical protein
MNLILNGSNDNIWSPSETGASESRSVTPCQTVQWTIIGDEQNGSRDRRLNFKTNTKSVVADPGSRHSQEVPT